MHHALVFSTSKQSSGDGDAASRLANFANDFAFLHPLDAPCWLLKGNAAGLLCQLDDSFETKNLQHNNDSQTLRRRAAEKRSDVNNVPADWRRNQILIADIDSTIITSESLNNLAALTGLADIVTAIIKRAMVGEIDFEGALFERVIMLTGKSSRLFDQLIAKEHPHQAQLNLFIRCEPMEQNAVLCRVDLTSSSAQLLRFAVFMTIAPIMCMRVIQNSGHDQNASSRSQSQSRLT